MADADPAVVSANALAVEQRTMLSIQWPVRALHFNLTLSLDWLVNHIRHFCCDLTSQSSYLDCHWPELRDNKWLSLEAQSVRSQDSKTRKQSIQDKWLKNWLNKK